jgi:hypothetical protein
MMLAFILILFFITGLLGLATLWVGRITRRRQDERDARLTAALRQQQIAHPTMRRFL